MPEISIDPIRVITRVWAMGKLGQILISIFLAMVVVVVFVLISKPSVLVNSSYYGTIEGFGLWE